MREHISIYTIIRTSADADHGSFPPASAEGSFLSLKAARAHLHELVRKEKDEMKIPFDKKLYCEVQDDDFWEAYQDNNAIGWFVHYEIFESELKWRKVRHDTQR